MKVTEYDNRSHGGGVGFYTKRGKVTLDFKRNVVMVYRRNPERKGAWYFPNAWTLVNEWKLKA